MTRCKIQVGHRDGLRPNEVVALLAHKGHVHQSSIGRINIYDNYSEVDIADEVVTNVIKKVGEAKLKRRNIKLAKAR